jgi:YHS domain-containing protein
MFLNLTIVALAAALGAEAVNQECPISGRAVVSSHTTTVGGKTVGFCCPRCPPAFAKWSDTRQQDYVAAQSSDAGAAPMASPPAAELPASGYLLSTCPVTGKKLGSMGDPVVVEIEGREVRLCCMPCKAKFQADTAKYFKIMDTELANMQRKIYPMTTCLISDEELGDDATEVLVQGRLVRVCCNGCARKVKKAPEQYIAQLDAAVVAAQLPIYPMTTCPIGKGSLDGMGGPVNMVVGGRLIQICCEGCREGVMRNPAKIIAELDAAAGSPAKGTSSAG